MTAITFPTPTGETVHHRLTEAAVWTAPGAPTRSRRASVAAQRIASSHVSDWITPADAPAGRGTMGDGHINFSPFGRAVTAAGSSSDVEVEPFNANLWAANPDEVVATMVARWCELIAPNLA